MVLQAGAGKWLLSNPMGTYFVCVDAHQPAAVLVYYLFIFSCRCAEAGGGEGAQVLPE